MLDKINVITTPITEFLPPRVDSQQLPRIERVFPQGVLLRARFTTLKSLPSSDEKWPVLLMEIFSLVHTRGHKFVEAICQGKLVRRAEKCSIFTVFEITLKETANVEF